jgi:hypothetical protein
MMASKEEPTRVPHSFTWASGLLGSNRIALKPFVEQASSLFVNAVFDEEKSFITLTHRVNVIKLFSFITDDKA